MWIFADRGFFSIVADINDPDSLLVRARLRGDIEHCFPKARVVEGAGTDYRYRAFLPRKDVANVIAKLVTEIDYPNFKASIKSKPRANWYGLVWLLGVHAQEGKRLN